MTEAAVTFTPVPDPTFLTTEQLTREILHLKELVTSRLDAMDKAVALLQSIANRSPSVNEVFLQHEQKFATLAMQLSERDARLAASELQARESVHAALEAAERAVFKQEEFSARAISKSEAAVAKQIDQLGELMAASNKATDEKIGDLKERLAALDGRTHGMDKGREPLNAVVMLILAALIAAAVTYFVSAGVRQ